ncbi:Protein sensitivity to red light reduced 1 [Apostasia shenzhenica]|uniref:Protein sensitivity to red light reduced 1 n=1 Tax=Apostasia shenzhenica TaxID=1088818 RepID=A0A2I0B239_9ASPA|nr:Protein sensitivity to red light reduced 1 [Apostasia shenzhenica]
MSTPPPETLNSNNGWTLVARRRGGKAISSHPSRPKNVNLTSSSSENPSPWTPMDSSTDPVRESNLLRRMQSSISRLENSRFFCRFLSRMRDRQIQGGLQKLLSSCSGIQIVAYGIGSFDSYEVPRLQLALILLLKRELGAIAAGPVEVFDPVLSAVECAVAVAIGCMIVDVDEHGRRKAAVPTLFYMPHCEAALYNNLLDANWKPTMLNRMVVLGNSFGSYARYASEMKGVNSSVAVEVEGRRVLEVARFVREVEIEEGNHIRVPKDDQEEEEFYRAFHDLSWHFFEIEDDADMDFLSK